jgi:hypothetical protein
MNQNEFDKKLDKAVKEMTKKYDLTKHRLLNYGGMIGSEFQAKIKDLKMDLNFDELFENYLRKG